MRKLLAEYKALIAYAFFGACTTIVNVATYYVLIEFVDMRNVPATAVAWAVAVFFAFVTNKLWVFCSASFSSKTLLWEFCSFYACRLMTFFFDLSIMYLAVDIAHLQPTIWKALSDVLAIILNYVASKWIVFKKGLLDKSGN